MVILISARFHVFCRKLYFRFNNEIVTSYFRFFLRNRLRYNMAAILVFGSEKTTDIISDHLGELFVP